jgi:hypothetical protein
VEGFPRDGNTGGEEAGMRVQVVWHGTEEEATALLRAFDRACTENRDEDECCTFGSRGERVRTCAAHRTLLDQRALDGLLWMRRIARRLRAEELA